MGSSATSSATVEEKEEVVVVVVEKEWDVPLFLVGMVEEHEQYA